MLRHPDDGPTIGLLLCKGKNQLVVEYALRDTAKPIGVSSWQLTRAFPADLSNTLPAVEIIGLLMVSRGDTMTRGARI